MWVGNAVAITATRYCPGRRQGNSGGCLDLENGTTFRQRSLGAVRLRYEINGQRYSYSTNNREQVEEARRRRTSPTGRGSRPPFIRLARKSSRPASCPSMSKASRRVPS